MKIAIIAIQFGHKNIIKNIFEKSGVDYTLFLNEGTKKVFANLPQNKIVNLGKTERKSKLGLFLDLINISRKLKRYINKNEFDIIYLNMWDSIFASPLINKPIVVALHGTEIFDFFNSKNLGYLLLIKPKIRKMLNHATKIVSVSRHQIKNLPEIYKKKTIVITNGVDAHEFKPLSNIKQRKEVILFTGRFIEIKGIHEILSVAKELPQYQFWFAGEGKLNSIIKGKNIRNLGFQDNHNLVKLYNQATICIFPSHREGFPLCGLEAMSCGRAVIATPIGFNEYIKNRKDGIIIPTKDKTSLKNEINNLMNNPKIRKKIEKNARSKALKYSWENISKKYITLFKKIQQKKDENK